MARKKKGGRRVGLRDSAGQGSNEKKRQVGLRKEERGGLGLSLVHRAGERRRNGENGRRRALGPRSIR